MNKDTNVKGYIGAAWKNDDGRISIVLDPFVQINGSPDLVISLFPIEEGKTASRHKGVDDEIPFQE